MHRLPNVVKNRHGTYYLRSWAEGKETKRSLGTKDWNTVKLLVSLVYIKRSMDIRNIRTFGFKLPNGVEFTDINTPDEFEMIRRSIGTELFNEIMRSKGASPHSEGGHTNAPSVPKIHTKLLADTVTDYVAQKTLENSLKTLKEKESTYKTFQTLYGNVDTNSVSAETAISFKNKLIADGNSVPRINKHIGYLKDLFAYAIDHKLYTSANPFENLTISKTNKVKQDVQHYEQFDENDLRAIFEDPRYLTHLNKPGYRWLPFLGLYTGARLGDLAGLKLTNIKDVDGVKCFIIEKGKNSNSIRKVPIHKKILESGFMDYVNSLPEGTAQVFPHLKESINGYGKNVTRRFGVYLDMIGITDKKKSFHSFRSTFINALTDENVHPAVIMGIVGHYDQSKVDFSSSHFTAYQKTKKIAVLKEAVDRAQYNVQINL
jgi:integrase